MHVSTMTATSARRRIVVAMSGGVDSSVAAYILSKTHDVVGMHMNNWQAADEDDLQQCTERDARDAEAVCERLHVPLHRVSFKAEYWTEVFEPFVEGIAQGRTPNPDVRCNSVVKFGAMRDYVKKRLGVDWIATGHYARLWDRSQAMPSYVEEQALSSSSDGDLSWLRSWGTHPLLLAGADLNKDQSYFLSGVDGFAFENVLFPLGDWHKSCSTDKHISVREMAERANLPTAHKRDSTGICFVGERKFVDFIHQYLPVPPRPGNFVDVDSGQVIGRHEGSLLYTIGQGAKISGQTKRWFVVGRNGDDVMVCAGTHHPALYSNQLHLSDMNWIGKSVPPPLASTGRMRATCRTRHLQPLVACDVVVADDNRYTLHFDKPVRAITPGQMAALYVGDDGLVCLGGGAIRERGPTYHEMGLELPTELHPAGHNDLSLAKRKIA